MAMMIDPLFGSTCFIELHCKGYIIGKATGFFWKSENISYLISNWHIFSGREPTTGQPKNSDGAIPDTLEIQYRPKKNANMIEKISIPLYENDKPKWIQHKTLGQRCDVAAIKITVSKLIYSLNGNFYEDEPAYLNNLENAADMKIEIGMDTFVLGYPFGIKRTQIFPIWKRASIASDYMVNFDDLPCFLVDTATREGMSGSPVIARQSHSYKTSDNTIKMGYHPQTKIIGIYSGRLHGSEFEAQLGIVWRAENITEILTEKSPGYYDII